MAGQWWDTIFINLIYLFILSLFQLFYLKYYILFVYYIYYLFIGEALARQTTVLLKLHDMYKFVIRLKTYSHLIVSAF